MAGSGVAPPGAKILIVDDNPTNLRLLLEVLETRGHSVLVATSGAKALQVVAQARPDLVLLDVMMPVMDGYEVCRRLKADPATAEIPVVFITANDQADSVVAGFRAGAVDYIPKPFRQEEVLARVQAHIDVHRLTRELEGKNEALEETNQQLTQAHEERDQAQKRLITELQRELQTAHDLQMALMPTAPPAVGGVTAAGRCLPASQVGGDLFQYYQTSTCLAVALADVTGHGMQAAIPAVMFSGILDMQMRSDRDLAGIFDGLNEVLCQRLARRTHVTLTMFRVDPRTRVVMLANAGCPYPCHFERDRQRLSEVPMDALPLGVKRGVAYVVRERRLTPGDYLVLYSDGIAEATDAAGEVFGFDRTLATVESACRLGLPPEQVIDHIVAAIAQFVGPTPQADDITCVVVRMEE